MSAKTVVCHYWPSLLVNKNENFFALIIVSTVNQSVGEAIHIAGESVEADREIKQLSNAGSGECAGAAFFPADQQEHELVGRSSQCCDSCNHNCPTTTTATIRPSLCVSFGSDGD